MTPEERAMIERLERVSGRKSKIKGGAGIPEPTSISSQFKTRTAAAKKQGPAPSDTATQVRRIEGPATAPKHKFKAVQTTVDNIIFGSRLEARRYSELKTLQQQGHVIGFLRQVPFHLGSDSVYRLDFQVFWANGTITFEDTKGSETETFRLKMRLLRDLYPWAQIHILEKS